jgi:hypothetical protein
MQGFYLLTPARQGVGGKIHPMNQEEVLAWLAAHPYGEQDENGVDLSLLRENLKLTPRERLAKLQHVLKTIPRGAPHAAH